MTASSQANTDNTNWLFPFPEQDWHQTPLSVQSHVLVLQHQLSDLQRQHQQLQKQVDILQGRVDKTS